MFRPTHSTSNAHPQPTPQEFARDWQKEGRAAMASVPYHVVLPFIRDDDTGELVAEPGR